MSSAGEPSAEIRVLLVDDQPIIGEAVRRMISAEPGVEFLYCSDATQAMQMAADFKPTVILQDLVMPEVDGLTMLKFYRANPDTAGIPAIVLSTKEEPKTKAEAFALGANDYLVKLPDPIELNARIRLHSQGYTAQLERNAAHAALEVSEKRLAAELAEAAKYLMSLLPQRETGSVSTDWEFIPSAELGGDTFGYTWLDDDHFAVYLLDVCGHGLKAALLSISAMNVLRNQTLPHTDFYSPASVLSGMNEAFQMDRHDDMYFTIWYGVYQASSRALRFSCGGHPPAFLLAPDAAGTVSLSELSAPGMIIGAFPGVTYQEREEALPADARLYVFSDGLYEITRPDGSMMTLEEFAGIVRSAAARPATIPEVIRIISEVRGPEPFEDDVSIVEVRL